MAAAPGSYKSQINTAVYNKFVRGFERNGGGRGRGTERERKIEISNMSIAVM